MKKSFLLPSLLFLFQLASAQQATVHEEKRELPTYPFDNPDPVPILTGRNKSIYPYFSFDGFSATSVKKEWKVVKLENNYIEVYVMPEAGGKVWGAIEKSTGKAFIYRNDVMKFRNVAMRGPWTSGGIEFNFGIIGHTPATATPVDYVTRQNADGSVSCIVGNADLPSRTEWRVEIRLPKDKAYFETRTLWSNPTPLPQAYYNWMTGAAAVSKDLEFFYPGNESLEHNGQANPWPVDTAGHDLSRYPNHAFGSHTSLHTVGEYNDFMGGYYHASSFGFGHWALYDDMPGHKLWLWAQSRSGAIWKDLLTDSNGQYMEFQAGRGFNQYAASSFKSPISEMSFAPELTDTWKEIWFPVKEIGGLQDVSPAGVLATRHEQDSLIVGINSLANANTTVVIRSGGRTLLSKNIQLSPMQVFEISVPLPHDSAYEVVAEGMDLHYASMKKDLIKRPFTTSIGVDTASASYLFQQGMETKKRRNYPSAKQYFIRCLQKDRGYIDALAYLSELYYRSSQYDSAVYYANRALELNAYHPAANYFAGIAYRAQGDFVNALETFGWAARSPEFRSAAYTQMAGVQLQRENPPLAAHYALQALDFDRRNFSALKILAVQYRKAGDTIRADSILEQINTVDPLSHFAQFEKFLLHPSGDNYQLFAGSIRTELPYQTYLEVFLDYYDLGQKADALKVLEKAPAHPLISIWRAYLNNDEDELKNALTLSPAFVFPYRTETVAALEWALSKNKDWKFKYYLALNYWGINRINEAVALFQACGNEPDFAAFYASRAYLMRPADGKQQLADLQAARRVDPADWRNWSRLINLYLDNGQSAEALSLATEAASKFKNNNNLALQRARAQLSNGKYDASINTLKHALILPFEGSTQGKEVYEQAYVESAIALINKKKYKEALAPLERSMEWPENLGVGKPYDADNRAQQYLQAICLDRMGRHDAAEALRDSVVAFTVMYQNEVSPASLLALNILQKRGNKQQLEGLLQHFRQMSQRNDPSARWVVAVFDKDDTLANELEPGLVKNYYFKIITEILALDK